MSPDRILELDPQIRAALRAPAGPPAARGDWKARRDGSVADFAYNDSLRPEPVGVASQDFSTLSYDGAEIALRWYTPADGIVEPSSAALLYLHGGSMILGSIEHYDRIVRHYVADSGVPALSVDYRLAPEHPHPTPSEDCYAALEWLARNAVSLGADPARIAVMGDSAGGALSAAVTLMARDRSGPSIAQQLLLYPMLDDRTPAASPAMAEATFTVDDDATGWQALLGAAVGTQDVSPYAAPARATNVSGLPPLYLDVGGVDVLWQQDVAWAARLAAAGTPVELHVVRGANHAFEVYAPDAEVSRRARADRIRVLRSV